MKIFATLVAGLLLALSCATASDARQQAKRDAPNQSQPTYYDRQNYNQERSGADCPVYHCNINAGG